MLLGRVRSATVRGWASQEAELAAEQATLAALPGGLEPPAPEEELYELTADRCAGPPDGPDAWLADLPGPLLKEYLEAIAEPEGPEPIKAGFWDRTKGDGAGFASGGVADDLDPGPVLAGLAAQAWSDGLDRLTDDELIGVLRAARRLTSWAAALELTAAGDLARRREAEAEATGDSRVAEHVPEEVAAALTLTARAADTLVGLAASLAGLPATLEALTQGRIDRQKAVVIADEAASLAAAHRAAVEHRVLPLACRQTTSQLRASTRRAVIAADPKAAQMRQEKAQREARVERWAEQDGTAALAGRDLPPADALVADQHVSELARALKAAGAAGTMDQLRAQVFLALLAGRPVSSPLYGGAGRGPSGAATAGGAPGAGSGIPCQPAHPGPAGNADAALDSVNDGVAGFGTPASGTAFNPGFTPAGANDPGSAPVGAINPGFTPVGAINLTMPLATWLGLSESPGDAAGFGPLGAGDSRALARSLADHPATRWCITITDSHGRAVAHGRARAAPGLPRGPDPPTDAAWLAAINLEWLETTDCTHQRESPSYRPPASVQPLIKVRQRTCGFPGCRRPAKSCDLDHTIPYEQGGRTCECNLATLCRRHHGAKQARGWRLDQPEPGILVWSLPHGRTYRTEPSRYPS